MLCDSHCHLFLGCPPSLEVQAELKKWAALSCESGVWARVHVKTHTALFAWYQSAEVQRQIEAFALAPVECFYLQTVDVLDLLLHVALWPHLQETALKGRLRLFAGLHPFYLESPKELCTCLKVLAGIRASFPRLIFGIGEVGLDKRQGLALSVQCSLLEQLLIATAAWLLPYSFHCVGAHAELLAILRPYPQLQGVVHGFNGSVGLGKQYHAKALQLGLGRALLSVQNQRKFTILLRDLPEESFVLESDFDGRTGSYDPSLLPTLAEHCKALVRVV